MFSKGFHYRWGVRIKDFGERLGHIKIFSVFIFNRLSSRMIGLGLKIKYSVGQCSIGEMRV